MRIHKTRIPGAHLIEREPFTDERGSFARMFCKRELEEAGLCADIAQVNLSTNYKKGALRGLHTQKGDYAEDKIVTCFKGSIYDVCVDLRNGSPTYLEWVGETLSVENGLALYIPKGCAHGYLSLTDDTMVLYFVTQFYASGAEAGYRFDDPAFGVAWPLPGPYIMSDKDSSWAYVSQRLNEHD